MAIRPVLHILLLQAVAMLAFHGCLTEAAEPVNFNRDIRPVLASRCFACHGPDEDERMGSGRHGLRLDTREGALEDLGGYAAIVPRNPDESELVARIKSHDEQERMPPPESADRLDDDQIELFVRWIREGGFYAKHWSYIKPKRPALPTVKNTNWPKNPVDHFVLSRLEQERLEPSSEANRFALIRRLSLDLIGLPPTVEEADAFAADTRHDAYERLVDRLLAKPSFGEHWASKWLDLARYADSAGYADDPPRTIWAYRDWSIRAINENMPFDRFTIEQIAGDLLPSPTDPQLIATAFHRNTPTNNEGGTNDEEFRNVAVVDRVNTTMSVWMGTTMGCAQCHTHKYDPITQEEYFRFFAILNSTQDTDKRDESPTVATFTEEQRRQRKELRQQIDAAKAALTASSQSDGAVQPNRSGPLIARFIRIELPGKDRLLSLAEVQVFCGDKNIALGKTATQSSVDYDGTPARAVDGNTDGHFFNAQSTTHTKTENDPSWQVDLGKDASISRIAVWNRTDSAGIGNRLDGFRVVMLDANRQPVYVSTVRKALEVVEITVPDSAGALKDEDVEALAAYARDHSPKSQSRRDVIATLTKQLEAIKPLTTPILRELPEKDRRQTHLQYRGSYQDLGEAVTAGVPAAFQLADFGEVSDRLALANWLVNENNPLTARVAVNRLWEQIFGTGIVRTSDDFGSQGELPSHGALLDWLATEFVANGWNRKSLIRLLVTSATYRQSSRTTHKLLEIDPDNRLLTRGARYGAPAEVVRDQSLFVGGLLSQKMFGPPVRPPQPRLGLNAAFGGGIDWTTSEGEERYRRAIYTFWRRSNPYPPMVTFGAPNRSVCTIRRPRTNTPLQALVTLNDPAFIEAAQALARRMAEQDGSVEDTIGFGFRCCLIRPPRDEELASLVRLHEAAYERFSSDRAAAEQMATDPLGPAGEDADLAALASWTAVANVLMNLDEMLMRR